MSILSISFPEVLPAPPTPFRASIRTLNGPRWARCKLGSDLKPRSITNVTDLGCWVLPSAARSLKDHRFNAVTRTRRWMSLLTKTSRCLLISAQSTHVGSAPLSCFPACGCSEWLCSGDVFVCCLPWPATQPPALPPSAGLGVTAHKLLR